jgi:hypothetical protein
MIAFLGDGGANPPQREGLLHLVENKQLAANMFLRRKNQRPKAPFDTFRMPRSKYWLSGGISRSDSTTNVGGLAGKFPRKKPKKR